MSGEEKSELVEAGVRGKEGAPSKAGTSDEGEPWPSELDEEEDEGGAESVSPEHAAASGKAAHEAEEPTKANTLNRSIARFIDILIALLLAKIPGYIGFLAGLTYVGIADGLSGGRGVGKRIIGLRVFYAEGGRPGDYRASILRNSTIGLLYILFHIPLVGWALACLGLGFELLLIIGSPEGRRLGDEIAGTVVVDEPRD